MIPIGHQPTLRKTTSLIIYLIISINIFVFLLEMFFGERFIAGYATVPYEITHNIDLVKPYFIKEIGNIIQGVSPDPIYLTILTAMFMHGSLLHILGNMIFLWVFGEEIEDNFGHFKFLIFYLLCGLLAAFTHIISQPDSIIPSLGASGAIAGVLGSYIIIFPSHRIKVLIPIGFFASVIELPASFVIGFWFVVQLLGQFTTANSDGTGIAYMAHIGGFIAGIFLSRFFYKEEIIQSFRDEFRNWNNPNSSPN
ncbi:MAG: rhomboid family intramembrane serine protease [Acidobacteria bacterium]|nr:rhomboid family intramembrane serine protease [Acidobacteriota bacterium]